MSGQKGVAMSERKRILIVDDEPSILFTLCAGLKKLGNDYEIVTARNGQEALARIEAAPFDLIITDLKMPGIGGIELTEAVRAAGVDTVVIWVSAYGGREVEAKAKELEVHRYLSKPLNLEELRQNALEALEFASRQRQERLRLARELHDGPVQMLTTLSLRLDWCYELARHGDLEGLKAELAELTNGVRRGIDDFRHFILNLRAPISSGERLADVLERYVREYGQRTGIAVTLEMPDDHVLLSGLTSLQQMALLRVVQEALQNVYKHAGATRVAVTLNFYAGKLRVEVRDNGRGFDVRYARRHSFLHMGLAGMEEWAREVGGWLEVESTIGEGSTVALTMPLTVLSTGDLDKSDMVSDALPKATVIDAG